jgi:CheY-like chemotaxis protein
MTKILLVEDDDNLREIFEMRLQADGYETATASDGEEALTVAMREKPDLIVADIMMPKLSGFEMLETLRAAPEMSSTKVIMMTALGQAEDQARGEKLGVLKYLVKSQVTLEDFARVVRDILPPGKDKSSSENNKQESEKPMPEDNAAPTNPAPSGDNPVSGPSDSGLGSVGADQPTADEAKEQVEQQVNDFAASTPAAPPAPDAPAGDGSDVAAPGGDTPAAGGTPAVPPAEGDNPPTSGA